MYKGDSVQALFPDYSDSNQRIQYRLLAMLSVIVIFIKI